MATTSSSSPFMSLNWADLGKGILMAILTPIITIIYQTIQSGSLTFDFHSICIAAVSGFIAYITKNFFSGISLTTPPATK
jgi:hypothetical protein